MTTKYFAVLKLFLYVICKHDNSLILHQSGPAGFTFIGNCEVIEVSSHLSDIRIGYREKVCDVGVLMPYKILSQTKHTQPYSKTKTPIPWE